MTPSIRSSCSRSIITTSAPAMPSRMSWKMATFQRSA